MVLPIEPDQFSGYAISTVKSSDARDDDSWSDSLKSCFLSPAGRDYRLSVESFDGTGGSRSVIDDAECAQ